MARDHRVKFRSETDIAGYAAQVRAYVKQNDTMPVDVISIIRLFEQRPLPSKGTLVLRVFDKVGEEPDAKVTFDPLTLHVDEELWLFACMGDPYSRFVLAHEIGHLVLHNKDAKAFAGKESQFGIFGFDETSAEWQAHTFAGHLLAPDDQAKTCANASELAVLANIETHRAQVQLDSLNKRKLWRRSEFVGEACKNCANFTLSRLGLMLTCTTCNAKQPIAC